MNELKTRSHRGVRWNLLITVSAVALAEHACGFSSAYAADPAARPTVWIELGGQVSKIGDNEETYAPPLFDMRPPMFDSSAPYERLPRYSFDEFGKITIEPRSSSWDFSASVRYGRSSANKHVHQQTRPANFYKYHPNYQSTTTLTPTLAKFADTKVRTSESHFIMDFQAGKDVGLGMFGGKEGSSVINFGVRFAQFVSRTNLSLASNPDWHLKSKYLNLPSLGYNNVKVTAGQPYHSNVAAFAAARSFRGIGPSLSWNASAPVMGDTQGGEVDLDWGLNLAVLFGRQKAQTEHHETGRYNTGGGGGLDFSNPRGTLVTTYRPAPSISVRSHSATVPNVGGFAAVSFHYDAAKISFGYRGDFFFGAMDGGIDTRRTYDRSFFGPYAAISIGLGG